MTDGFTKLFSSIVHSTVWRESNHVRLVWVTMLALSDKNGRVMVSVPGLADAARVTLDECVEALDKLSSPDKWSRTKTNEGRRVAECDGGWQLLNYLKYRAQRDPEERREQTRKATEKWRENKVVSRGEPREPKQAQAEAEAEAEAEKLRETRALDVIPANQQLGERLDDIAPIARREFIRRYSQVRASVPSENALAKTMPAVVAWLRASAPLQRVSEVALLGRLMDAFFASEKAREAGYKPGFLAHDPSEWLEPPRAPPLAKPKMLSFDEQKREAGVSKLAAFDRETESFLGYAKTDKDRKTWADERAHARMLIERKLG